MDKAFDGLTATKWYTGGNTGSSGWIQADFGVGNEQVVVRYDISSANDAQDRDPKDWQFQGSPDGSTWTTLDTRSGEVFSERYQTRQYTISNSTAYRYYKLNILSNYSGSAAASIQLSELAMMVPSPVFTVDPINNEAAIESNEYAGQTLSTYTNYAEEGERLFFSKLVGPTWLTVASDGTLSGIAEDLDVGVNHFTVCVENTKGFFDVAEMTIPVLNTYSGVRGIEDLVGVAARWLSSNCVDTPGCSGSDLNGDAKVDLADLACLAGNWQAEN
jgi:hypothetical protein